MCVYFFCIFLSSFLSCATQKNSLTLFVIKDTKDDDDDDFDDFDDGAYCEERPKSPKEGTDESANRFEFFFLCAREEEVPWKEDGRDRWRDVDARETGRIERVGIGSRGRRDALRLKVASWAWNATPISELPAFIEKMSACLRGEKMFVSR